MKYYVSNPVLDAQIKEIRQKIRLSMNGITSDLMTQNGISYKKNYGVAIPRLKEIATAYTPNHDLAQRLWALQIRETMILATMLEPYDKFTPEMANNWVEDVDQIEIIELTCMNLLAKVSFANLLCIDWMHSEKLQVQIAGYILAARVYTELTAEEIETITQKALLVSNTNEFHLYKAVALCLSRFCRMSKETALRITNELKASENATSQGHQFISDAVRQEILYLSIL